MVAKGYGGGRGMREGDAAIKGNSMRNRGGGGTFPISAAIHFGTVVLKDVTVGGN